MTIYVETNAEGIVTDCAPVARKFQWYHVDKLRAWMASQGGYKEIEIDNAAPG